MSDNEYAEITDTAQRTEGIEGLIIKEMINLIMHEIRFCEKQELQHVFSESLFNIKEYLNLFKGERLNFVYSDIVAIQVIFDEMCNRIFEMTKANEIQFDMYKIRLKPFQCMKIDDHVADRP